jgi:hypothetical protein
MATYCLVSGTKFDGVNFTAGPMSDSDIVISNTTGPIHLMTLCRALKLPVVTAVEDSADSTAVANYLHQVWDRWQTIAYPNDVKVPTPLPAAPIASPIRSLDYQPVFRVPKVKLEPKFPALERLALSPEHLMGVKSLPTATAFRLPVAALQIHLELVRQYIKTKQPLDLEGKACRTVANVIARLDSRTPLQAQQLADQVLAAIHMLASEGELFLSTCQQFFAPVVPADILTLAAGGEVAEPYLPALISSHHHILDRVRTFTKLVNVITNSCLKQLCDTVGSQAPAYYASMRYLQIKIYYNATQLA